VSDPATVVLVHGAWHGAWCWEKVVPLLEDTGVEVVAVQLPLTSLHDDADAVRAAIDGVGRRVVLCGHSYGGAVITEAGHHPSVEHLVYLTAFACDEGESPSATAVDTPLPSTDLTDALAFSDDGTIVSLVPEKAVHGFYHDCDQSDVDAALARLRPMSLSCLTTPLGPPAWREKRSMYVVCTADQGVHPELQRLMAKRCTESVEWPTAHSPFLNRPDLVADLLTELAT
jgi:pimeloyl-ACP methyl ester carboxylesterase